MTINSWRLWLGVGVSVLLILLVIYQVDLSKIVAALGEANYAYVIPAVAIYFIATYFRAFRWRYLLAPVKPLSVFRIYWVVIVGYTANNLLPARLGELVRSYYLARREGISGAATVATVAVERVYDGITLLALAALAAPVLLFLGAFDNTTGAYRTTSAVLAVATVAVFLAALAVLVILSAESHNSRLIERGLSLVPSRFRPRAGNLAYTFVQGLGILSSPKKHLALFALSLPIWMLEGAIYLILAYSFGINDHFSSFWLLLLAIALLTATSNLITAIPAAIGGIGPFEIVAQQTLVGLGVGAPVATSYALVLHIVALWIPVNLVGLAVLWKQNLSLKQLSSAPSPPAPTAAYGSGVAYSRDDTP